MYYHFSLLRVLYSRLCIYHFFVRSNLNFFHNSLWIILPTQLCLVLYSFCASLLDSLMWLIVSSLSTYICYFVGSYLFSLLYNWSLWCCFVLLSEEIQFHSKFPFLGHVHVFFRVRCRSFVRLSFVCCLKYPYNCFSSHICFLFTFILLILVLSALFLVADTIPSSRKFKTAGYRVCIHAGSFNMKISKKASIWGQIYIHIDENRTQNPDHGVWDSHKRWWLCTFVYLHTWPQTQQRVPGVVPRSRERLLQVSNSSNRTLCHENPVFAARKILRLHHP